ncbi:hypothetical protein BD410DRAFT_445417 [Rickenella mellea]|uniref:Uncharacterized protein n=1 Tax=Rickenella mellea TaxID=50990 RepID=A0A4Y7PW81_9AGAM|nr:hypothetical protein BD410DRAFT_445417 [Rickenella mellea]
MDVDGPSSKLDHLLMPPHQSQHQSINPPSHFPSRPTLYHTQIFANSTLLPTCIVRSRHLVIVSGDTEMSNGVDTAADATTPDARRKASDAEVGVSLEDADKIWIAAWTLRTLRREKGPGRVRFASPAPDARTNAPVVWEESVVRDVCRRQKSLNQTQSSQCSIGKAHEGRGKQQRNLSSSTHSAALLVEFQIVPARQHVA